MINKLVKTDDLSLRVWADQVKNQVDAYIMTLDVPVSMAGVATNSVHGKHPARKVTAGADNVAYFGFIVPIALRQFREVKIRVIPTTTGVFSYTVNLSYGAGGGDENTSTRTVSVVGATSTDDILTEIDITSLFVSTDPTTQISGGDQMGVELVIDGLTTTTELWVTNLHVKYM